uniref:hypothetical protein n=1 Tax=uncultured Allobacillus sp. TaxID=1638025 RepID=UPI00259A4A0D|nr:hypothetical protein [uncultured Allobacillus sp.]
MSKSIICNRCHGEIRDQDELVTSTIVFEVVAFHDDCYTKDLKGAKTIVLDNKPLNGFSGNATFIIFVVAALLWVLFADESMKWMALFALLPIGLRLVSYFRYERHLKNNT